MTRRKPAPAPLVAAAPRHRRLNLADAEFLAAIRQAANHLEARGEPVPGLPTIVRIAANELERFYAADLVAPPLEEIDR
jgi:hypothetical protein